MTWHRHAPVAVAVLIGMVLVVSALLLRVTVARVSDMAARGEAELLVQAFRERLPSREGTPDVSELASFLEDYRSSGLRYVGLWRAVGQRVAEAGDARGDSFQQDGRIRVGDRVRVTRRVPPPRLGRALRLRPEPPGMAQDGPSGPRPPRGPAARLPPLWLVLEFEPTATAELDAQANALLGIAAMAAAVVTALGVAFARSLRLREELTERLEHGKRLALLGEMSAVLAHEIRNPLAALKGHAQLLSEMLETGSRPRDKAARVVQESVRLERLLATLLNFAKSGELARASVDPHDVIEAAAAGVASGSLRLDLSPDVRSWSLDAAALQQVLENVLRNAVQANGAGEPVEVTLRREAAQLVITVRDHGPGIAEGDEALLFEPFFTRRTTGSGLGLAISRRIVEAHGGVITAHHHPEGGAVFRIAIPPEPARRA